MAKWARIIHEGKEYSAMVDEERLELFDGGMLDKPEYTGRSIKAKHAQWLAPVEPIQFFGLWNNFYERRAREELFFPKAPLFFMKVQSCVAAHQQPITVPPGFKGRVKFEAELGLVVGKRCFQATPDNVDDFIFGYTCVNDVTAPEVLFEEDGFTNWCRSKSFPTFGPVGPWIDTSIEPDDLWVNAILNGERKQHYPVNDMIYKPREVLCMISREIELLPGDVIALGTSTGAVDLSIGDEITVEVPGLGSLTNKYSG